MKEADTKKKFANLKKDDFKQIHLNQLPKVLPNFKNANMSKDLIIEKWLTDWIVGGLKSKTIEKNSLIPKKAEIAYYLSVSTGTIQNAIRYVEDKGFLQSKQRLGTFVQDVNEPKLEMRKLTSKREKMIAEIKKYIVNNNYKKNQELPSSRQLAMKMNSSTNTVRLALENLASQNILENKTIKGNEKFWVVKNVPKLKSSELTKDTDIKSTTLVEQVEKELKSYIFKNYKVGDRLCSHSELASKLNVSIKTIHDSMKALIEQNILLSRRGKYGTTVIKISDSSVLTPQKESSIFVNPQDTMFYSYQKIEHNIKALIKNEYDLGEKLPAMDELSKKFNVSTNTIRKALQNLESQKIITFSRGRYGGTFVINIPEEELSNQSFKWLAVNPQYSKLYN